jgi:hypothetical protein
MLHTDLNDIFEKRPTSEKGEPRTSTKAKPWPHKEKAPREGGAEVIG